MKPADQITCALRALYVATELIADMGLAPHLADKAQHALTNVVVAGSLLEGLVEELKAIERESPAPKKKGSAMNGPRWWCESEEIGIDVDNPVACPIDGSPLEHVEPDHMKCRHGHAWLAVREVLA